MNKCVNLVILFCLSGIYGTLLSGSPRSYNPGFFDTLTPHEVVADFEVTEYNVFKVYQHKNIEDAWLLMIFTLNDQDCWSNTTFSVCYFVKNTLHYSSVCGPDFVELQIHYSDNLWTLNACNTTKSLYLDCDPNYKDLHFRFNRGSFFYTIAVSPGSVIKNSACPRISEVEYPPDEKYTQTILKYFPDFNGPSLNVTVKNSESFDTTSKLLPIFTTTTAPPTTTTTLKPEPLPLNPLSINIYIIVGSACGTFMLATILFCLISIILRKRRLRKQEFLFNIVLMRHEEELLLQQAAANQNSKALNGSAQDAFMANVKKVMEEDKMKEEISAIGDEAATPETFVKFMSLEPLYRRKGPETPENSTITTRGDSYKTPIQNASKTAIDETKSKTRTAETVQQPSSDNEWLQLSTKVAKPDILLNDRDQKDVQEYNALSQPNWDERVGELDSLVKIIKADLKAQGIKFNAESTQLTMTTEAHAWLQTTTSLHCLVADGPPVLPPSVFKLRYREQQNYIAEHKLVELYRSALLAVEKQHRISFLQMTFQKFAMMKKTTQKQSVSTESKVSSVTSNESKLHPYILLDRLCCQFPQYFTIFSKSSEQ